MTSPEKRLMFSKAWKGSNPASNVSRQRHTMPSAIKSGIVWWDPVSSMNRLDVLEGPEMCKSFFYSST
jgi:hypothetical protein